VAVRLAVLDAAAVFAAACAAVLAGLRTGGPGVLVVGGHALAFSLCSVAWLYYCDLYDLRTVSSFRQSARRLPLAVAAAMLMLAAYHVLHPGNAIASVLLAWGVFASVLPLLTVRAVAYRLMDWRFTERVVVIGTGPMADQVIAEIQARPYLRQRVVGVFDEPSDLPRRRPLDSVPDLDTMVEQSRPHRIIVALGSRRGRMPVRALLGLRLRGIAVEDGAEVYERLTGKIAIEALTPTSLIFCKDFRPRRRDLEVLRGLSQPLVAGALVLLAPLLGLVALAIKLDSPGPVFFVQERVGRGGRRFKLVKFRTMRPAQGTTSEWVRDNGDRLTRVGRWLRRFRLDELPQLVNILKGDMNLVGPRPHPVSNLPLFVLVMRNAPSCGEPIPYYALRWMVRPGLTGWAQVRYRYANDLEEEIEKMRHDLYYIKHMSPWLDLLILFETVKIVLRGRESPARVAVSPAGAAAAAPARVATRHTAPAPPGDPAGRVPVVVESLMVDAGESTTVAPLPADPIVAGS
jgi:exopolysaccharide biosynthesis polyprenyl glycosylphosphotransferase